MASLIIAAGVFTYDRVKTSRTKRKERKESNATRFAELEKYNAERMARIQGHKSSQGDHFSREGWDKLPTVSAKDQSSRRSSLAEEGPPPPGYEEAMRNRLKKPNA